MAGIFARLIAVTLLVTLAALVVVAFLAPAAQAEDAIDDAPADRAVAVQVATPD